MQEVSKITGCDRPPVALPGTGRADRARLARQCAAALAMTVGLALVVTVMWTTGPALLAMLAVVNLVVVSWLVQRLLQTENQPTGADAAAAGQSWNQLSLSSLVQNSADMISILAPDGTILYESPSVKNVLGYEPHELEGSQSSQLVHPDDLEKRRCIIETICAIPNAVVQREIRFRHRDGSWRWLETVTTFVDDEARGLRGLLVNSRDVTQRRIDEEKLRIYTERLETSNRELQEFAYIASHDLQEPLRKVQAFGDRLESKCGEQLSADGRDYLRRMRDASSRMQRLINDLLKFSRVTTNAQPFETVDLGVVAADVVSDIELRIEQSGGKVEIEKLPTIDADASQMRQLFQNLLCNALKFHRPGVPPEVRLHATDDEADEFCRLIVEDNGIGFDERHSERIFTVFQRLHGRGEFEGSGIGLAICRKIAERHGGRISAESTPGAGSRFIVELPRRRRSGGGAT